jgi:putative endonuclease
MKLPCVYLMASKRSVWQHKKDVFDGFTKRYGVHALVWYETCGSMETAITREKAIKEWKPAWKIRLIEETNPNWLDLYEDLI